MTQDEIQKVQQALMLAEMFFLATPIDTIEKMGNPLGKVLGDAIATTLKYTDYVASTHPRRQRRHLPA